MSLLSRTLAAVLAASMGFTLLPSAANAAGTIKIQRQNGTKNTYSDVEIKVFSGALFLTSHDGNGTIVVTQAACSYQGKIIVCLPITAALVQGGTSNALSLKNGTIYLNYTDDAQPLASSSGKLAADSVLLSLTLKDGTVVDVRGRIDEVVER